MAKTDSRITQLEKKIKPDQKPILVLWPNTRTESEPWHVGDKDGPAMSKADIAQTYGDTHILFWVTYDKTPLPDFDKMR